MKKLYKIIICIIKLILAVLICCLYEWNWFYKLILHINMRINNNRPFYSCRLSDLASELQRGWRRPCFDTDLTVFIMQIKLLLC